MELTLKMDDKGRILIPAYIRRKLNFKNVVKVYIEEDRLIIKSIEDPIERLTQTVIRGSNNIEKDIKVFRKISEEEALKRLG